METAVIIPLFNGERWIRRTLESVFAQTLPPREVVVVDDGCQDRSAEIVREFPQARLIRSPRPEMGLSRDHGAANSAAPLITFLDQDDLWSPTHLESLVSIFRDHPLAVAACGRCRDFQENGEPWFEVSGEVRATPARIWEDFPFGRIQNPSQVLMRRSAFDATGGWLAQTRRVGDVELWHRLELVGEFLCNDAVTVGRRLHRESYGRALRERRLDEYLAALQKAAEALARLRSDAPPEQAAVLARRVNVAAQMAAVGASLSKRDSHALLKAMARLVELLDDDSDEFRASTAALMAWFAVPVARKTGQAWMLAELCLELEEHPARAAAELSACLKTSAVPSSAWRLARWALSGTGLRRWKFAGDLLQARRRIARAAAHQQRLRDNLARLETNVDADGWAPCETRIQLPKPKGRSGEGARLGLELPEWSQAETITVSVATSDGRHLEHAMKRGQHQLIIPFRPGSLATDVVVRAKEEPFVCGDARRRAFRVFGYEKLESVPSRHMKLRRWKELHQAIS